MLKVIIQGPAGAGKTALAATLDKLLEDAGYSVTTHDDGSSTDNGQPLLNARGYIPADNDGRKVTITVENR